MSDVIDFAEAGSGSSSERVRLDKTTSSETLGVRSIKEYLLQKGVKKEERVDSEVYQVLLKKQIILKMHSIRMKKEKELEAKWCHSPDKLAGILEHLLSLTSSEIDNILYSNMTVSEILRSLSAYRDSIDKKVQAYIMLDIV